MGLGGQGAGVERQLLAAGRWTLAQPGLQLEGVATNVAAFGAFVDVGVHQDGLVHISELADRFVRDPREVVKAGDVVRVRVKVDLARKRIALTMKSVPVERGAGGSGLSSSQAADRRSGPPAPRKAPEPAGEGALAAALRRARERK
jgi:uncharacterized protein